MNVGPALIDYLVEFYAVAEIRAFWKQAGDALMTRSTVLIHINKTKYGDQEAEGLNLATPAEQTAFMEACKAAINRLEGGSGYNPSQHSAMTDFSRRYVGT